LDLLAVAVEFNFPTLDEDAPPIPLKDLGVVKGLQKLAVLAVGVSVQP